MIGIIRLLFLFTWLMPLLMVGWVIGLVVWPILHGILMIKESIVPPTTNENEH